VRFLVVGCGSIGKRHIGNLLHLAAGEVIAMDLDAARREETAGRMRIEVLDDLDRALDRDPEVVLVATPPSTHLDVALRAALRGCHLFVEKPLADRIDGLDELERTTSANNLVTMVGCNMRFHPGLVEVKRLIDEGAVGRVVAALAQFGQYLPSWHPREDYRRSYSARRDRGGGVILDAIHEIDYLRWMLGDVTEVACFAGTLSDLEIDTEDTAAIVLRFATGAVGEVHLDYVQHAYTRGCRIIGTEGVVRWDHPSGETAFFAATTKRWETTRSLSGWDPNEMYVAELRRFLRCLTGREPPLNDLSEARKVLQIAVAAKTAAERHAVLDPGEL
jgi:predicted dehydrogenase